MVTTGQYLSVQPRCEGLGLSELRLFRPANMPTYLPRHANKGITPEKALTEANVEKYQPASFTTVYVWATHFLAESSDAGPINARFFQLLLVTPLGDSAVLEAIMEPFQYDPIIHEEHAFRIVRLVAGTGPEIQAEIIHASLDESDIVEYEAVSYVWGSSELVSSIDVGGKSLKITNNLELVLRDLRLPDQDRLLWIDGVCIDQNKDKEKTHQVRQMRNIYQRAERVLFHIGPSTDLTHILHETLTAIRRQQNLESGTPTDVVWDKVEKSLALQYIDFGARILNSVESILSAPWFRRVWIVQEVANARRALIYWGHASFQVAGFVHLVQRLGIKIDDHQTSILDMMPQKRRSQSPWSHRQDLYNLLRRFKQAKATQNHDKIFALLGMCTGGKGHGTITVDYEKSEDVVISEVVAHVSFCEKEDLSDFCFTLESVDDLLECFDTLLQDLVVYMATNTRLASLRSLLSNRKVEITITEGIFRAIVSDTNTGPEAVGILLAYTPDRTILSVDLLRRVVINANTKGNTDVLEMVLKHNIDANIVATVLSSELVTRTYDGTGTDNETIQELLNSSTMPSRHLCLTARNGNLDSMKKFLEEGADINAIDPDGLTPLGCAAASGQGNMVDFLLASSAHIETGHQSPLSLAVEHGHKDIVQLLLNRGADIEHSDKYGRTPLSLSASGGCRAILSLGRSEFGQEWLDFNMRFSQIYDLPRVFEQIVKTTAAGSKIRLGKSPDLRQLSKHLVNNKQTSARGLSMAFGKSPNLPLVFEHVVDSRRAAGRYQYGGRTCHANSTSYQIPEVYSEIVDLLIQKGANTETRDCLHATPLWWAANYGHLPVVVKLLGKKAEARAPDIYGFDSLIWALWNGHQEVVERLFNNVTTLDGRHNDDYIFWAICNGCETQVQWLIDKGIDTNNGAVMSWAIISGHASIVKLLLGMNTPTAIYSEQPSISLAASLGHEMVVQVLLDHGEAIESENSVGLTPLMLAAKGGHYGTVRLLLNKTANVNSRGPNSRIPVMYTAQDGSPNTTEVFFNEHGKLISKDDYYNTDESSLSLAAQNGHHEVARLLLEHGADINASDSLGVTPLMLACRFRHKETVKLLLQKNAMIYARDWEGRWALHWAECGENKTIVEILKESGSRRVMNTFPGRGAI